MSWHRLPREAVGAPSGSIQGQVGWDPGKPGLGGGCPRGIGTE